MLASSIQARHAAQSAQAWKALPPLGMNPRGFHGLKPNFCDETRTLLHGYLDGELDMVHSLALARHLQSCPTCTRLYEAQQGLQTALRGSDLYYVPPRKFCNNVQTALRRARRDNVGTGWWESWWRPLSVAAVVMLLLVWPGMGLYRNAAVDEHVIQEIVAGHVRSLLVNHLTDVTSSDRHIVKPWFEGALDFSPPVPDFSAQGFPLIGGRLDYLGGRQVAALVYRRHQHAINLFVWPTTPATLRQPQQLTRQGYQMISWTAGDLTYWTVSTLNSAELQTFADAVIAKP